MSAVQSLYQAAIVDHSKRPRNFGALARANRRVARENPLCGDQITLYLRLEGDLIADVAFEGEGCAIALASASMMSESIKGKTIGSAQALWERFQQLVREGGDATPGPELGALSAFAPVSRLPARVECACLAWRALGSALQDTKTG